jgi:hypothetical protein
MSILKVANVHFDSAGTNRIDYLGDDKVRITSGAVKLPVGNTAGRPVAEVGLIRYNTESGTFEGYNASSWSVIASRDDLISPFVQANTARLHANASFEQANTARIHANASFEQANTARIHANASFAKANSALSNTTNSVFAGNLPVLGNVLVDRTTSTVGLGVKLDVNGAINASAIYVSGAVNATDFNSTSDIKLKKNINTITNGMEIVSNINSVSFDWIETDKKAYGVIAQEIENVLPEVVTGKDTKQVSYIQLIAILIAAVKELNEEFKKLKNNANSL